MKPKYTLYIDASRVRSGGGILHLQKLLDYERYCSFDRIVVYIYQTNQFDKLRSSRVEIKTHPFLNKNIFFQIYWQRYLLPKCIEPGNLLFTIDSTSFCRFKCAVVLNQDLIGFQNQSLKLFSFKNKIISFAKYLIAKKALKNSLASIFTTNFARKQVLIKTGTIKNSFVVPHGIDCAGLERKKDFEISEESLKVIYVSPILDYKNHGFLIDALNNLPTKRRIKGYFLGGGDPILVQKLKKQALNQKGNQFYFWGFLEHEELFDTMRDCDIAVFLSSVECFGITLLEYMRVGMPIVCSKESCLPEILKNGGILVDPRDPKALVRALNDLAENKAKRLSLSEKAYDNSIGYSWENTAKETYSILERISKEYL